MVHVNLKSVFIFSVLITILSCFMLCGFVNSIVVNYLCLIYIIFFPGFFITILISHCRLRNFSDIVILSIGLSIFVITSLCIVADVMLPIIGIPDPIRKFYLVPLVFGFSVLLAAIVFVKFDKIYIDINYNLRSTIFLLCVLMLNVIGALVLDKSNLVILISFSILSVFPFLYYYNILPRKSEIFAIWIFAVSLILYNSLFGNMIRITDNVSEILTIKDYVLSRGIWENDASNNILGMPNVVLFVPFLDFFTGGIIPTYKFVIPLISSLIPVALYKSLEKFYGKDIAVYSSFFFSSLFVYFDWVSVTMKMVSGGLYLSLILLLLLRKDLYNLFGNINYKIILAIFSLSLIFSHYGTAAIFAISLIFAALMLIIIKKKITILFKDFTFFVILYCVLYYGYSLFSTKSSIFSSVTVTIYSTLRGINMLFTPENYGSEIIIEKLPLYLQILKILYILSFLLIIVGLVSEFIKKWKSNNIDEFILMSVVLTFFIVIPYVFPVGQYGGGRIWYISLIFTVPFFVMGFKHLFKLFRLLNPKFVEFFICIYLFVFFIFNSGYICELSGYNVGPSVYISYPRIAKNGNIWEREYFSRVTLIDQNILGAGWIYSHMCNNKKICCDINGVNDLFFFGLGRCDVINKVGIPRVLLIGNYIKGCYIYLTKFNTYNKVFKVSGRLKPRLTSIDKIVQISKLFEIYSNNGSSIYL